MSSPRVQVLERITRVAPLGLRFRDAATNAVVQDALEVTAYPPGRPQRRVWAVTNRAGVYVIAGLPGLREAEFGAGDSDYWDRIESQAGSRFVVEAVDHAGRFLPARFTAELPARGLYGWSADGGSSPLSASPLRSTPDAVPLFSAPSRTVPAGLAVVRAELWDSEADGPAAWAVLAATTGQEPPALGMADVNGRLTLLFPYPDPGSPGIGSPSGMTWMPPVAWRWTIRLQAHYSPRAPVPEVPDLRVTLNQHPATLYADAAGTRPLVETQLAFGHELVLRPEGLASDLPPGVLRISPTGSSPLP